MGVNVWGIHGRFPQRPMNVTDWETDWS